MCEVTVVRLKQSLEVSVLNYPTYADSLLVFSKHPSLVIPYKSLNKYSHIYIKVIINYFDSKSPKLLSLLLIVKSRIFISTNAHLDEAESSFKLSRITSTFINQFVEFGYIIRISFRTM